MKRFGALSLLALTGALLTACNTGVGDITIPALNVTVSPATLVNAGTATFTAATSDESGISKVEFYDNGTLVTADTAAPYEASKAYAFADNGAHTIMVKAYDGSGNIATKTAPLTVAIADRNEPNNSVAAATALTVGTPVSGVIAGQDRDQDYFKFTAAAGEALKLTVQSVSVDAKSTLDPYVMILMPDGRTVLEKDDDSGAGLESEIRFNAPAAGTYTAVVTSFDIHDDATAKNDRVTNTYQIALTRR
ncbi:DVUA0089 family protein [Deinococcus aquaticus]|uniref:DVUA0089 family protein n=1 Tax=Deinococcus aquaticus TaxID=328692 RepID=A0ABY7V3E7_9DEIO|nr:DVUA0089 family protein [Deinococcus aquaticus]WDA59712.1 DVUA0089 family protein [Deinococcus aquaticus]